MNSSLESPPQWVGRRIRFTRVLSETQEIVQEIGKLQFSNFRRQSSEWEPDVDIVRFTDRYEICADLAGVSREEIELLVQPRELTLQGIRRRPAPRSCPETATPCRQTLAMEIKTGSFRRIIRLPESIEPEGVTAKQENGMLWITLPLSDTSHSSSTLTSFE
ncbi:MAG: Hsp20/alpha crystallin family protein [Verrucomicrobiota bacterium]